MRERRYKKVRSPRSLFLVICEGETEREYIEMLKVNYRLPIAIRTKVSGSAICQRLVNKYISELGLSRDDDCQIFYIYDADVCAVVDKLRDLPGTLILTNPCIELWYLLHIKDYSRAENSACIVKTLKGAGTIWQNYNKGNLTKEQADYLLQNSAEAIRRAKGLNYPANPSSSLFLFIEALEKGKMR